MRTFIECKAVLNLRDRYIHEHVSAAIVEAHLAECETCLDAFIEETLNTPPPVVVPEGFAATVAAPLTSTPEMSPRRFAILSVSGLVGVTVACFTCLAFLAGKNSTPLLTSTRTLVLAVAMVIEFAVVLFVPEIVRAD
jgi:predicted anti-sigma-YlaC factor YlaD